jgi:hypothetical protein
MIVGIDPENRQPTDNDRRLLRRRERSSFQCLQLAPKRVRSRHIARGAAEDCDNEGKAAADLMASGIQASLQNQ